MIESVDIYRNLKLFLEKNFENIPVQIKDIKTPKIPCFYIRFITENSTQTAIEYNTDILSYEIVYFASGETLLELFEIKEKLKNILNKPIKIEFLEGQPTQYIETTSVTSSLNEEDYVLNMTLNFEITQYQGNGANKTDYINRYDDDYDNEEYMEELEI